MCSIPGPQGTETHFDQLGECPALSAAGGNAAPPWLLPPAQPRGAHLILWTGAPALGAQPPPLSLQRMFSSCAPGTPRTPLSLGSSRSPGEQDPHLPLCGTFQPVLLPRELCGEKGRTSTPLAEEGPPAFLLSLLLVHQHMVKPQFWHLHSQ